MNNERRKQLKDIVSQIEIARDIIGTQQEQIESVRDDEQSYLDDMPENFQSGEKGERAQAAIDALDEAINAIECLDFDEITNAIENAVE